MNSRLDIVWILLLQLKNGNEAATNTVMTRCAPVLKESLKHKDVLSQPTQLRVRDRHWGPKPASAITGVVHVDDILLREDLVPCCPGHVSVARLRKAGDNLSGKPCKSKSNGQADGFTAHRPTDDARIPLFWVGNHLSYEPLHSEGGPS